MTSTLISNDVRQNRYTISLDDQVAGFADYRLEGHRIVFTRTEVDPAKRKGGLAGRLVEYALDDVRTSSDLTVVPQCSFVAHFIDQHPDYQELVDRG
ncbi:GNAT family N-acetyltransferase [Herbiconiux sp. KACC 21604]|uniref:GNAT family N-acetyltransferase n=1 Tax=unclassified Herbiconiux TaxID=2618217 RepID=UPI001491ACDD|nr:GNAT family N-acetyltransferase [Herbiconiux sp. SALV-R1]QJU55567.1 N-acetyltransferase [Herbiconiux sp. SALV-R1]WPO86758.1 GNAT family N-acetyltransferase [Herbiconiux sp. KACC 21604]